MYVVELTAEARSDLDALPLPIVARVLAIFERLRRWPDVSGAKPLRRTLRGNYRIRTGSYRVLFRVETVHELVVVWKIDNRRDVYED